MSDERNTLPDYEALTDKEVRKRAKQLADVMADLKRMEIAMTREVKARRYALSLRTEKGHADADRN